MFKRIIMITVFLPTLALAESPRNWVMISTNLGNSAFEYYCAMDPLTVQAIAEGGYSKPFVLGKSCFYYDSALNLKPYQEAGNDNGRFGWDGDVLMRVSTIQRMIDVDNQYVEARWEQKILITPKTPSLNR